MNRYYIRVDELVRLPIDYEEGFVRSTAIYREVRKKEYHTGDYPEENRKSIYLWTTQSLKRAREMRNLARKRWGKPFEIFFVRTDEKAERAGVYLT